MDKSIRRPETGTQQFGILSAGLQFLARLTGWLAGLFQLTEEEKEEAGILYPDDQRNDPDWQDEWPAAFGRLIAINSSTALESKEKKDG